MTEKKGQIYEFEGFKLDPVEGQLVKDDKPLSLQPKAFGTLVFLVERHGHLVEKAELIDHVWEDTFVEEAAVSRCVWQIRAALGVDSKDQKFIQTVPKRGYRFVADVVVRNADEPKLVEINKQEFPTHQSGAHILPITRSGAHAANALAVASEPTKDTVLPFPVKSDTEEDAPLNRFRPVVVVLGALILSIIVLLGIGAGSSLWQDDGLATQISTIAVLPFVNESGDPQIEYLSDGMTDTLISSLSELPNIKVKARTSVFRYKGKEIDPKAFGKGLGVQAIVTGRVSQRDGRTSVMLEVVDTETENVIFSTKYDKPHSELVTLQRDIARDVSTRLKSKLSGAEEAKVTKTHTADPEALELYLQGQFYRHKGGRSNVLQATDYFNKAVAKDPNYALAYASLALNYGTYFLYNIAPPSDYRPKGKAAAMRAVELDDSLAEAHVALGRFQGEEREFRRAIELNPNYSEAYHALCVFLTYQKRFDDAITEGRKAQELDPSSAIVATDLGASYAYARRPDEAMEILRRAHEMDPTLMVPLGYLGFAQTLKGQYTEAITTFRKAMEVSDGSPNIKGHLAYALAKAGQRDEALKLVDELKRQAEHEHINSFHFATPYIGLSNKDEAFFWLGKGVDEGETGFAQLDVHPWFDDLRSDPRFKALLERAWRPGA